MSLYLLRQIPVCQGTSVTFTASPVNGGAVPQYQWSINGFRCLDQINPVYSYVPANGDVVQCELDIKSHLHKRKSCNIQMP